MDVGDEGYAVAVIGPKAKTKKRTGPEQEPYPRDSPGSMSSTGALRNVLESADLAQYFGPLLDSNDQYALSQTSKSINKTNNREILKKLKENCTMFGLAKYDWEKLQYDRHPDKEVWKNVCKGWKKNTKLTRLQKKCKSVFRDLTCRSYYADISLKNSFSGAGYESFMINVSIPKEAHFKSTYVEEIWLRGGVLNIGKKAFAESSSLSKVGGGSNLKRIEDEAFRQCENLEDVDFGDALEYIGNKAFWWCHRLKNVAFGTNLRSIGDSAFQHCHGLVTLNIPSSVTTLGKASFQSCENLTSITIGAQNIGQRQNVLEISDYAFYNCNNLKTASIYGALRILMRVFEGCVNLEQVVIGEGLKFIGDRAFYGCKKLKRVALPSSIEEIQGVYAFGDTHKDLEIVMDKPTKFLNLLGKFGPNAKFVQK